VKALLLSSLLLVTSTRPYVQGYRVQAGTDASPLGAWRQAEVLRGAVDLPVEIQWEDGVYKVRVGSFVSRTDASPLLARVREVHPDAWVVSTVVRRDRVASDVDADSTGADSSGAVPVEEVAP